MSFNNPKQDNNKINLFFNICSWKFLYQPDNTLQVHVMVDEKIPAWIRNALNFSDNNVSNKEITFKIYNDKLSLTLYQARLITYTKKDSVNKHKTVLKLACSAAKEKYRGETRWHLTEEVPKTIIQVGDGF